MVTPKQEPRDEKEEKLEKIEEIKEIEEKTATKPKISSVRKSSLDLHCFSLPYIASTKWHGKTIAKYTVSNGHIYHGNIYPNSKKSRVKLKELELYYTASSKMCMTQLRKMVANGFVYRCYVCERNTQLSKLIVVKRKL